MKWYLITFRSVTYAQRGEKVLRKAGVACTLQRTPKGLSDRGCSYCLRLKGADALNAVQLLRRSRVEFGKLFAMNDNGTGEEREV